MRTYMDVPENEKRYRFLFDKSQTINMIISKTGLILDANERAALFFGIPKSKLIGKSYFDFVLPESIDKSYKILKWAGRESKRSELLSSSIPEQAIIKMKSESGERMLLYPPHTVVVREGDAPVGYLLTAIDITEIEQARIELSEYRDHLEQMVKERTAHIEALQAELVQKERLAALGRLTATVSHEIRNPLGTISSSLYSIDLKTRGKNLGIQKAVNRARRNIKRCDNIIEELLDFTREKELQPEPTNVDEWIAEILEEQSLPEEIASELHLNCGQTVSLDRDRFRRCIINVLLNACQAMVEPDGTGSSTKKLIIQSSFDGDKFRLRISDTGKGIDRAEMARVFEPLFSTKSFGVGLGLPNTKQIMEKHRGDIEIKSEPGKGTSVDLWIPLHP